MFDLDGTVVNHGTEISPRVLDAFEAVRGTGCVLGVSSGRPISMVPAPIRRLPAVTYFVTSNGACVRRDGDDGVLLHRTMTRELALDVIEQLKPYDPGWSLFLPDRAAFEWKGFSYMLGDSDRKVRPRDVGRRFVRSVAGVRNVRSVSNVIHHSDRPVEKLGCSFPSSGASERARLALVGRGDLEVVRMGSRELEITLASVSKGTAVSWLANDLGISRERTVAFGDGGNDMSMVGAVGCFVAMGNADGDVKAAATDVTATISEDGVALWLEAAMRGRNLDLG